MLDYRFCAAIVDAAIDMDNMRLGKDHRTGGVATMLTLLRESLPRDGDLSAGTVSARDVVLIHDVLKGRLGANEEHMGEPASGGLVTVADVLRVINDKGDEIEAAWDAGEFNQSHVNFLIEFSKIANARIMHNGHTIR